MASTVPLSGNGSPPLLRQGPAASANGGIGNPGSPVGMQGGAPGDVAQRKQRRMMKNRESACLSRRKKKEYVDKLEKLVADGDRDRAALRERVGSLEEENGRLRARLAAMDSVVDGMPSVRAAVQAKIAGASTPTKAGVSCVMAVLFCVALFGGPNSLGPTASSLRPSAMGFAAPLPHAAGVTSYQPAFRGRTLQSVASAPALRGASSGARPVVLPSSSSALAAVAPGQSRVVPPPVRLPPVPTAARALDKWLQQHEALLAAAINSTLDSNAATSAAAAAGEGMTGPLESGSALSTHVVVHSGEQHAPPVVRRSGGAAHEEQEAGPPFFRLEDNLRPRLVHSVRQRGDTSYIFCTEVQVVGAQDGEAGKPLLSLVMPTPQNGACQACIPRRAMLFHPNAVCQPAVRAIVDCYFPLALSDSSVCPPPLYLSACITQTRMVV